MVKKSIVELAGGEVLARPLMSADYQVVLPEGAVLRKEYIDRILELGILEVYVKTLEDSEEIVILKSEVKETITAKVKNILQRHTYHKNNKELEVLSEAADHIITNILEEEQVVEKIFDIKQRSNDIYEHSINVCSLSILTALKMQIDSKKIHDIGVGCLLHDIGLRYMAFDPSSRDIESLNANGQAEYKKHPVYGYSSVADQDWISNLSKNIILYHHERLDGSGYPLRTSEIPIECQIVAVCDTFDEMICGICCKRVKVYEAVEFLKSFKNVKFNATIVDTFLSFTAVYPAGSRVRTNRGEIAVVVSQNKEFQDRPVIRVIQDANGKTPEEVVMIDLIKVHNVFIEEVLDD